METFILLNQFVVKLPATTTRQEQYLTRVESAESLERKLFICEEQCGLSFRKSKILIKKDTYTDASVLVVDHEDEGICLILISDIGTFISSWMERGI